MDTIGDTGPGDGPKANPAISLRLPVAMAREFRMEAARRGMRLNALFEEMWALYKERRNGSA